jgi:phosphatidylglycerophosphate synthase
VPVPAPAAGKPREVEELVDEYFHRPLAGRVVNLLAPTRITPNQVTLVSGIVGVAAGVTAGVAAHRPGLILLAGILLFVATVLDCCDGQLARLRRISSTTGAILDGIADYAVGISMGIGGSIYMAAVYGSPWYWLLGLTGLVSTAAQSALFDHAKTRYIARVGRGYAEREEDLERIRRDREKARAERRHWDAFLLWVYQSYSTAQQAALTIPPVADPAAYRAANAGRMRAWTFLGIGTHLAPAYVSCIVAYWWPPAVGVYFAACATILNLWLALMLTLEARQAEA